MGSPLSSLKRFVAVATHLSPFCNRFFFLASHQFVGASLQSISDKMPSIVGKKDGWQGLDLFYYPCFGSLMLAFFAAPRRHLRMTRDVLRLGMLMRSF
jgi:hypothetical protein